MQFIYLWTLEDVARVWMIGRKLGRYGYLAERSIPFPAGPARIVAEPAEPQLTADRIRMLRDWFLDCAVSSDDLEARREATDTEVIGYVARHYAGGLAAFDFGGRKIPAAGLTLPDHSVGFSVRQA